MNKFEYAVKNKLRFPTSVGKISVEDLYNLPTEGRTSLRTIAEAIQLQINAIPTSNALEFFKSKETKEDAELKIMFELVKHVVEERMSEQEAKTNAKANEAHNEKIKAIIAQKENQSLESMSVEQLKALIK